MVSGIKPQGEIWRGTPATELQNRSDREFSKQLEDNPTLDGRLIEDIEFVAGENKLEHKLGRKLRGWWVTRRHGVTGNRIMTGWIECNGAAQPVNWGGDIVWAQRIGGGWLRGYLSHTSYTTRNITEFVSYNWYLIPAPGNVTDVILQGATPLGAPAGPPQIYLGCWLYDVSAGAIQDLSNDYHIALIADVVTDRVRSADLAEYQDPDADFIYLYSPVTQTVDLWVF
jgi:hypothetical protein